MAKTPKQASAGKLGRRPFLIGAFSGALALGAGALWWRRSVPSSPPGGDPPSPAGAFENAGAPARESLIFGASDLPLALAVAEAIVPTWEGHPGAGREVLLPHIERCLQLGAEGLDFYRDAWPEFQNAVRSRISYQGAAPPPEVLEALLWELHHEYERLDHPSLEAAWFEGFRRAVLLAYYTTAEGWASLGYAGPPHLSARALEKAATDPGVPHG